MQCTKKTLKSVLQNRIVGKEALRTALVSHTSQAMRMLWGEILAVSKVVAIPKDIVETAGTRSNHAFSAFMLLILGNESS